LKSWPGNVFNWILADMHAMFEEIIVERILAFIVILEEVLTTLLFLEEWV